MSQSYSWPVIETQAPVGGATAANQVLEIAQLTAINANTNGLETSLNEVSTNTLVQTNTLAADGAAKPTLTTVVAGLTTGNIVQALETNSSGQLSITDGGGSITVDGTVASTQSGAWNITNISGTVSLPTGAATESTLSALNAKVTAVNTGAVVVSSSALPTGAATETTLSALNTKVPSNLTVTSTRLLVDGSGVTQPTSTTLANQGLTASTSTLSNVSASTSSVSILASNSSRKGMMVYNDSAANLYLKLGTTASATSFTVLIPGAGYYELPANPSVYTGAIDGIWSSATGTARVTELS